MPAPIRAAVTTRPATVRAGWVGADRGASPVELAILLPVILLLLFASIQVGVVFVARSVALNAAQLSTSAERAHQAEQGVGAARARAFLAQAGDWLTEPQVTVSRTDTEVTTVVRGRALSLVPGFRFTVDQRARGTVERFTTDGAP